MYLHRYIARAHTFQTMQAQHACVKQVVCDTVCCAVAYVEVQPVVSFIASEVVEKKENRKERKLCR